ncbi:MAG: NAD(P)/FAD-dependent oxidoreductase [Betaproteobacteria bacterium]
MNDAANTMHRIVIVGGGAGGLELATRLGNTLGAHGRARVTLVDRSETHMWKPLLHEVAAGSLDVNAHQIDFLAQAHWHHFEFRLGALEALDRAKRTITIGAVVDAEGLAMLPRRELGYDTLVIGVGSVSNDFGVPGVRDYASMLDSTPEAERFHRRLIAACARANAAGEAGARPDVNVVIIGAGATGVELAAQLRDTTRVLASYGLASFDASRQVRIRLMEAAPRILPALPERVAVAATSLLEQLDVEVLVDQKVVHIDGRAVATADGRSHPYDLAVWAAGVKGPDWLAGFGGLTTNRLNQVVVRDTLQSVDDDDVFVIGDCAQTPWRDKQQLPPLAQAAHQQSLYLARMLPRRIAGAPLRPFRYHNYGSLVSLGETSAVGRLMGGLIGGAMFVEGVIARIMYISNYTLHLAALHGWPRVVLGSLGRFLRERTEPRVKLH